MLLWVPVVQTKPALAGARRLTRTPRQEGRTPRSGRTVAPWRSLAVLVEPRRPRPFIAPAGPFPLAVVGRRALPLPTARSRRHREAPVVPAPDGPLPSKRSAIAAAQAVGRAQPVARRRPRPRRLAAATAVAAPCACRGPVAKRGAVRVARVCQRAPGGAPPLLTLPATRGEAVRVPTPLAVDAPWLQRKLLLHARGGACLSRKAAKGGGATCAVGPP